MAKVMQHPLTPPPSTGSPSPIPSPDHMYHKQEPLTCGPCNETEPMIVFDTEENYYEPIESNYPETLDMNDFVDENIVNLFPELM